MKHSTLLLLSAFASLSLASCSPDKSPPLAPFGKSVPPTKTTANTAYRSPWASGATMRNPDVNMPSNFDKAGGVSFSRVAVAGPYVAITFDDGPHASNTPRLLDMLRVRNIKATFYVIGKNVEMYPGIVRRTVAEGHEIGNHSYTHTKLSGLSNDRVMSEMRKTEDAVFNASGVRPRTMRPPYGALTQTQRQMVHQTFGYPTILWDVDPLDWKRPGSAVVTSRILNSTKNGSIILVHDLHGSSVDAMPETLDRLLKKGYRFVTVSQLLTMAGPAHASIRSSAAGGLHAIGE
jgi:peptidoglycan/xylan/chitin deacetylase (PgdA/CDA1 family)